MRFTGLLILASTPAGIRRLRELFQETYAGLILVISMLVNLATGFAQSTHSLTIPSMQTDLGISYTQAGILVTVSGALRMGSSLASGTLAPRYGSRIIIGICTIGAGASMLLLAQSANFLVAMVAMLLIGITTGAALTPMMGLHAPWFAIRDRGLVAGLAAAGGSIAFVAAGIVAPWFIDQNPIDGWRHTWRLFGVIVILVGILALLFLRDRPKASEGQGTQRRGPSSTRAVWPLAAFRHPMVWLLSYLAFCSGVSHGIFSTFFGAYLVNVNEISLDIAGRLLILIGVLSVFSGVLWGHVSDRVGRGRAFVLTYIVQVAGFALFWITPVLVAFVVSAALLGLTLRAAYTICVASSGDYVEARFAAAAFAMMSVGAGLGSTISPVIAGAIADTVGMRWAFALAMFASAMGVAGGLFLTRPISPATEVP